MRLAEEKSKQKFAGGDDFTSVRKIWLRIFLVFSHYGTRQIEIARLTSYVIARALAGSPIKNFGAKWMIFLAPLCVKLRKLCKRHFELRDYRTRKQTGLWVQEKNLISKKNAVPDIYHFLSEGLINDVQNFVNIFSFLTVKVVHT